MSESPTESSLEINKSLVTNVIAACCIGVGLLLNEPFRAPVINIGLFALSGAITNWLAIYMLFEKVPGLYGSGVIPARFEDFKLGIHDLIMNQFFTKENVEGFFAQSSSAEDSSVPLDNVIENLDLSPAFDVLIFVIKESPFGGMLGMLGGDEALEPLREPFILKMKESFKIITQDETFQKLLLQQLSSSSKSEDILNKVGEIVQKRLEELTPQMVKEIIQKMIKKHLGWLVVWGGVFGGLIGLVTSMIQW